jgi:hypothetical protein
LAQTCVSFFALFVTGLVAAMVLSVLCAHAYMHAHEVQQFIAPKLARAWNSTLVQSRSTESTA